MTPPDALYQLFAGYFHEDWADFYASRDEALQAYVSETGPAAITRALDELRVLRASTADGDLPRRLDRLGASYLPEADGITPRQWIDEIAVALERRVAPS
jgi:hypothetical protein